MQSLKNSKIFSAMAMAMSIYRTLCVLVYKTLKFGQLTQPITELKCLEKGNFEKAPGGSSQGTL